jgi:hypothetical protein
VENLRVGGGIRSSRLLWKILWITAAFAGLALLSAYVANFYAHHKALELLAEVGTLEAGKTTVEDVQELVRRYGGEQFDAHTYIGYEGSDKKQVWPDPCLGEALSYAIYASPPLILTRALQAFPVLQIFGLHPWFVSLNVHQKEGRVTCYSQNVVFIRPDGQEVEASASLTLRNPQSLTEQKTYQPESFVSRNYYHQTRVEVLPEASTAERVRGFKIDLSCTVSFRGCYFPCQIIPLGWLDSVRDSQSYGRDMLPEGADDPRCPAH